MKKIILLLPFIIILSGCYNYRDLNKLAITSALGIGKNGENYEVTIQVINTQKQGNETSSSDKPKFTIYKKEGKTIDEALKKIILESPRDIYLNHLSILIIDDQVAREGLTSIIDLFARDTRFRKQFLVLISKNNETNKILSILTNLETLNAKNIRDSILTDAEYLGASYNITFEDILIDLLNDKSEIIIPSIIVTGNTSKGKTDNNTEKSVPDSRVILDDTAIFKGDKLIGYISNKDSINLSYIKNEIKMSYYNYNCEKNKYTSINITKSKSDINIKNEKDLNINLNIKGYINNTNCDYDLTNYKDIEKMEKKIGNDLEKNIIKTIYNIIDKYNSDVFGFQDIIYKTNSKIYKILHEKYNNYILKNLNIKVNVKLNLITKGNILKEIKND